MKFKRKKKEEYIYNEHDKNQVYEVRDKIRKKKKKRRECVILVVAIILFLIVFFTTGLSKVQSIKVNGCQRIDQQYVLDHISVKASSTYFFNVDQDEIEKEAEKLIFVKKANVSKSLNRITINIEEDEAMTYCYIDNILYVVDQKGNIEKDPEKKWLSYVQRCPQTMNFDEKSFKTFVKEYTKIPSVVKNQISSIIKDPAENDPSRIRLEMDDGKIFYVRTEEMAQRLTSTNYYMVIQKFPDYKYYDFLGKNVYVSN